MDLMVDKNTLFDERSIENLPLFVKLNSAVRLRLDCDMELNASMVAT
jgi:hypothetical protein